MRVLQKGLLKRITASLLAFTLVSGLLPVTLFALDTKTDGHWSAPAVKICEDYGIIDNGFVGYNPDEIITRAEFCQMINRAFNFTNTEGAKTFSDIDYQSQYGNDLKIASAMGYMSGYGDTAGPDDGLTREQAFTMLAKIYELTGNSKAKTKFNDDALISDWARASINEMSIAGYVNGTGDGMLSPQTQFTKGQSAQVLWNLFGTITDKGTDGGAYKNLTIRKSGITLKNAVVNGDLFITDGIGKGDVMLENITVKGRTLVTGGGSASVDVNGSDLGIVNLNSRFNTHLNLSADTKVKKINLSSSSSVTHGGATISYDAETGKMTFDGEIEKITLNADGSVTLIIDGISYEVVPSKTGANKPITAFELAPGATVKSIIVNAPVTVSGTGKIESMEVHAEGIVIDKGVNVSPGNIKTDKDIKLTIGGVKYVGTGEKSVPVTAPSTGGSGGGSGGGTTTVSVTGVAVTPAIQTIAASETIQLTATISPATASNKNAIWSTDNASVATVSSTGLVKANTVGTATITVKTVDGNFTAACSITVVPAGTVALTLFQTSALLLGAQGIEIPYTVYPTDAVVTVDATANANVTVSGGKITINQSGKTAQPVTLTVKANKSNYDEGTGTISLTNIYADGDGSAGDPYQITTVKALDAVRVAENLRLSYKLMNDLDLDVTPYNQGEGWEPIGVTSTYFGGDFNGNDFSVKNLMINRANTSTQALFSALQPGANVRNLHLSDVDIKGLNNIGGIVALTNGGTVTNCSVSGELVSQATSPGGCGGIVGNNNANGTIQNCFVNVVINGGRCVGGIAGQSLTGTVQNCYSAGTITGIGSNVGGIVGASSKTVTNCYSIASVVSNNYAGGIVGANSASGGDIGLVSNCAALNVSVSAQSGSVLNYLDKFLAEFNSLNTSMDLSEFITPFHIEIKDGIRHVLLNQLDFLKALERFIAEKDLYKLENDVNEYLSHISDFYIDALLRGALENSIDGYQEMRLEILDSWVKAKKEEKDEKFYGNDNKSMGNDKKGGFHGTDC